MSTETSQRSERRTGREAALQILFQLDANDQISVAEAARYYWASLRPESTAETNGDSGAVEFEREIAAAKAYGDALAHGVWTERETVDGLLAEASKNWRLERMARVDRNILRLAVYELKFRVDVPARVAINEAIEIAKRFGTAESAAFINGILDRASQSLGRL